jgi:hypothetical protein
MSLERDGCGPVKRGAAPSGAATPCAVARSECSVWLLDLGGASPDHERNVGDDAPLLFDVEADHVTVDAVVVGRLSLTATHLRFRSFVNNRARDVDIELARLTAVHASRVVALNLAVNGVVFVGSDGQAWSFRLDGPEASLPALRHILQTYGRKGGYRR